MKIATILLVESDIAFAQTMTQRLTKRQMNVVNAYSGEEALKVLADDDKVEAVILDDRLPGLDGFETLRLIRTLFPLIEVIMFTGHAPMERAIKGLNMGAFEYMMKICDMDYLVDRVMEAVAQKRRQEERIFRAKIREFIPLATRPGVTMDCSC
jgi:DNA-binding NtrC family response regulator